MKIQNRSIIKSEDDRFSVEITNGHISNLSLSLEGMNRATIWDLKAFVDQAFDLLKDGQVN